MELFGRACKKMPCANGGECMEDEFDLDAMQYKCICPSGIYGKNCQFKKRKFREWDTSMRIYMI